MDVERIAAIDAQARADIAKAAINKFGKGQEKLISERTG